MLLVIMTKSLIRLDNTVEANHDDYTNVHDRTNTNNHKDDDNDNRDDNR